MSLKGLKTEFARMQKAYEKNDKIRDQIIILSRKILKPSKQAIYSLHRNDTRSAQTLLSSAEKNIKKINRLLEKYDGKNIGAYDAALEEYVEAKCYESFIVSQSFPTAKQLGVTSNIYLLGLTDCTGELARRAVKLAIERKYEEVQLIHNTLVELTESFLNIEFRGLDMRKKLEGLKYNVAKTQNILYDLSMKENNK